MANSVNWQLPASTLSNQVQPAGKNGKTSPNAASSLFNQLLTTLVQEETALMQTETESANGMGLTGMGLTGMGTADTAAGGMGMSTSGTGLAGTGGFAMPTDTTTALLSMLLSSGLPAAIENSPSSTTNGVNNSLESVTPTGQSTGNEINQINQAVSAAAKRYGLPESLLDAVIHQESGGNPAATSTTGAMGLMQLMPATAQALGVQNPYSIQDNIDGGARYLTQLLHQFNGNISLALAGYNAGPAAVTQYGGIPPYPETKNYVRSILASLASKQTPTQL